MYIPLNYEQINIAAGTYSPSQIKSYNNKTFDFWVRSLFHRTISNFDFTLPDDWQGSVRDFFLYVLFKLGYLVIFNPPEFGQTFQPCTLRGMNWFYQPVSFIVANPLLHYEGKIGVDGEILKLTPDYRGVWDIIEYYAEKLSALDLAINSGIINSQITSVIGAKNKGAVEALKKTLDLAHSGEPTVIVDKAIQDEEDEEPWQSYTNDLRGTYLVPEQLQDFQTLLNSFDAEIGIPTVPYQKAERLTAYESQSKQIDGTARSITWLNTLKSSIENVKKLYPDIRLDVELRYNEELEQEPSDDEEEVGADEQS